MNIANNGEPFRTILQRGLPFAFIGVLLSPLSVAANELSATQQLSNGAIIAARNVADNTAPTVPGNLRSIRYSSTAGEIIWNAASDDTIVVGYQVFRDGQLLGIKDARSLFETGLTPNQSYTYRIRAIDRAGNQGPQIQVVLSGTQGDERNSTNIVEAQSPVQPADTDPNPLPEGVGSDDGSFVLSSRQGTVTLVEGDSAGVSIDLSLQRRSDQRRPITLSLSATNSRDMKQLRHVFSRTRVEANQSGSVLSIRLDVGIAPLMPHKRSFQIVADDGVSQSSHALIVDITPTAAPDVYLLIGQSNMEGYSEIGSRQRYSGGLDERHSRIQQLNVQPNSFTVFTNESLFTSEQGNVRQPLFVPAEDPLHEPRYAGVDGKGATFVGLGLTFAKQALDSSSTDIYLVPAAWGATGFCANANGALAWNATSDNAGFLGGTLLTNRALTRLNLTLRETGGVLRGIFWHQGGADSNNPDCARTYRENLTKLVQRLRRDARTDSRGSIARGDNALIPFVVATQSRGDDDRARFSVYSSSKQQVDDAHRDVASYISHADFVNNDDLVPPQYPCGQGSCVHFGAQALREQGRRFYLALTRIWERSEAYHF